MVSFDTTKTNSSAARAPTALAVHAHGHSGPFLIALLACLQQVRRWHAVTRGYARLRPAAWQGFRRRILAAAAPHRPAMAARRDTHGVPAWPGLLHATDPELTTGRGVFRHHQDEQLQLLFPSLRRLHAARHGVGLSDPHAKLFGCAEPRRREGRDGLGAGGWDAQLLYGLEGDMCAHTFKGKHKV